ncbi:MAG: phage/plasmid primase, P4 family, partial [Actinomycetota bacterium]|nr:phage/plasmid primase, P4 family [Actinomycetota bacterium]
RDGLDRKADGGYVAVPPSRGRTWTNGIPDQASLSVLPHEFCPKKAERSEAARSLPDSVKDQAAEAIARHVAKIVPGPEKGRHEHLRHLCGVLLGRGVTFGDAEDVLVSAWSKAGGELAERAPREVPNTLRTTEQALAADQATGVPSLERITPGLYAELETIFGWKVRITIGGRGPSGEVVHFPSNGRGSPQHPARFNMTELGNAERFVARHGEDVRYCYPWGRWLVWNGARWERDESGKVHKRAKETVRSIYAEAAAEGDDEQRKALVKHARASEAKNKIEAMLELAKSEVPVSPDELDAAPLLLNAPNGTVDLRTGELLPHRRENLITKMAGAKYEPDAPAHAWAAFLERVQPGEELREFIQRGAGYSASGDTSEQCMFINHGASGANGKSTFQEALASALGDYAMRTPTEMLLAKRGGGVPNDVARLKGARFVAASETEEGRRLAESLVKDLTGQDTISARFMRAEWFDFKPTHKLWLSTNHKPEIRGTDNAIWRRIRLVPWAVTIPPSEQDRKLSAKLRAELPGVLAWIVRGCLAWQREGLRAPDEVRRATAEYRAEMDTLAAFLADRCVVGEGVWSLADKLYQRYAMWCDANGERQEAQKGFVARLSERGFVRKRATKGADKGRYIWLRVGIREDYDDPDGDFGSPGEPRSRHGSPHESPTDTPDSILMNCIGEPSEAKNHINDKNKKPRKDMQKNGSLGSLGSPGAGEGLEKYLSEPPDWLRDQLARYAAEPSRWLKPTSS